LIRSQRLGAASELAGSVAHAISNPLTALFGHIQLMIEISPRRDPGLERLLQLAQRIRSLLSSTLLLFRSDSLNLETEARAKILEDVRAQVAVSPRAGGVNIEIKVEAGLSEIRADGELLRAALVSLVENAIEVTEPGGTVWMEVTSLLDARALEFRVGDAGPGVPERLRKKVLEPFFTTKAMRTGLGLAIAHGVVQGHGGRLSLHGRPGGGTLAIVELPLDASASDLSARAS